MRIGTFSYELHELPLVIHDGIQAAFVNGQVQVHYHEEGQWYLEDICVEGKVRRNGHGEHEWPHVPATPPIAEIIEYRLKNEWAGLIQSAIDEALTEDRACAEDDAARSMMK